MLYNYLQTLLSPIPGILIDLNFYFVIIQSIYSKFLKFLLNIDLSFTKKKQKQKNKIL